MHIDSGSDYALSAQLSRSRHKARWLSHGHLFHEDVYIKNELIIYHFRAFRFFKVILVFFAIISLFYCLSVEGVVTNTLGIGWLSPFTLLDDFIALKS